MTSFRAAGPLGRGKLGWLVVGLGLLSGAAPCGAGTLGTAGDDTMLWLYQGESRPDGTKLLYFAFLNAPFGRDHFLALQQGEIGGEVARSAVMGGDLYVFFPDGTHLHYAPVPRGPEARSATSWELNLPGGGVPLALAGDSARDALYAVVPANVAESLPPLPGSEDTAAAASPTTTSPAEDIPTPSPVAPEATEGPPGGAVLRPASPERPTSAPAWRFSYGLVRYQRSTWYRDVEIPADFDVGQGCRLAVADGVRHLFFTRVPESGATDRVWYLRGVGPTWSPPELLEQVRWSELAACGLWEGRPVILRLRGQQAAVLVHEPAGWREAAEVTSPEADGWQVASEGPVGALLGGAWALAWRDGEGQVRAGVWSRTGKVARPPAVVEALHPPSPPPVSRKVLDMVPYVLLTVTMFVVLTRRRDCLLGTPLLAPDAALASHGRRLAAALLDGLIMLPVGVGIMSAGGGIGGTPGTTGFRWQGAPLDYSWEYYWRWLAVLAAYIAYCTLFEAWLGATPGKRLVGCRVVGMDGGRCSLGAILVRNGLRCIEFFPGFAFAPTLVLIVLTRNRQRLGDLVARTVVIQAATPAPDEPDPPA